MRRRPGFGCRSHPALWAAPAGADTAEMGDRNVLGGELEPCGTDPITGFYRDGCCSTGPQDLGSHTICAVVTADFLAHQQRIGNDLSTPVPQYQFPGLVPGDRWCVTAANWLRAHRDGAAAHVVLGVHARAGAGCRAARGTPRACRRRTGEPRRSRGLKSPVGQTSGLADVSRLAGNRPGGSRDSARAARPVLLAAVAQLTPAHWAQADQVGTGRADAECDRVPPVLETTRTRRGPSVQSRAPGRVPASAHSSARCPCLAPARSRLTGCRRIQFMRGLPEQ